MKQFSKTHDHKAPNLRLKMTALCVVCSGGILAGSAKAEIQVNPFFEPPAPVQSAVRFEPASIPRPIRLPIVKPKTGEPSDPNQRDEGASTRIDPSERVDASTRLNVSEYSPEMLNATAQVSVQPVLTPGALSPQESTEPAPPNELITTAEQEITPPAMRGPDQSLPMPEADSTPTSNWLRSSTSQSTYREARVHLDQAIQEYGVGAWASAEASAWQSLSLVAAAIDMAQSTPRHLSAVGDLRYARTAIAESRDFVAPSDLTDTNAIARIAASHQSDLIQTENELIDVPRHASDRYLDEARIRLGRLATESRDAAEAMDLLAAIYLGRNQPSHLPGPTALCFRRAALQGQPQNASLASRLGLQLADTGLHEEAYLVLNHAYELEPTVETSNALEQVASRCGKAAPRVAKFAATPNVDADVVRPEVIQLSPSEFAAISKPVMQVANTQPTTPLPKQINDAAQSSPAKPRPADIRTDEPTKDVAESAQPSAMKRFTGSWKRFWKSPGQ